MNLNIATEEEEAIMKHNCIAWIIIAAYCYFAFATIILWIYGCFLGCWAPSAVAYHIMYVTGMGILMFLGIINNSLRYISHDQDISNSVKA